MPLYVSSKNIKIESLNKGVIVGDTIDLDTKVAEEVNSKMKDLYPDDAPALSLVGGEAPQKPKRKTRAKEVEKDSKEQ